MLRDVIGSDCLIFQVAHSAQFLEEIIQIFWQDFDHDFASEFSVLLFIGVACRDITMRFIGKSCDLLNRFVKAPNLKIDTGIADQFSVCSSGTGLLQLACGPRFTGRLGYCHFPRTLLDVLLTSFAGEPR